MARSWWLPLLLGLAATSSLGPYSSDDDPTYFGDIQPILARSCVPCHSPGGESPFSLSTYADAKRRASLIRWVCIVGTMPPIDANSELGTVRGLAKPSDQDLRDLQEWVRTGMKEGKPGLRTPIAPVVWHLNNPDLVLRPESAGQVPPEGPPIRKLITIDASKVAGKSIKSFSLKGASPMAFRHAYLLAIPEGVQPASCASDQGLRAEFVVGSWAPGYQVWESPRGFVIPPKARLAVYALYQPTGKPESADFTLALKLQSPREGVGWKSLGNKDFAIKPSDGLETLRDEWTLDEDRKLISILPECKLYAQQIRISLKLPDGQQKSLLEVLTWDRNWVGAYNFAEPVTLPKGATVVAEIDYDNSGHSAGNREARPTTSIKFGSTDKDEHFWVHLQTIPDVP